MTQTNNLSVRDAEVAENINRNPTFEEVYAMPSVRDHIESVLDRAVRQYKLLAGYKDDLRQEILIHLANDIENKFTPGKSLVQTFARVSVDTGIKMARRNYFSSNTIILANALDISEFEIFDGEDQTQNLSEEELRSYAAYSKNNVDSEANARDVREFVAKLPDELRCVAEMMMQGFTTREISAKLGIAQSTFCYKHLALLKKKLKENFSKKV